MLRSEAGDSVSAAVTNADGRFVVRSPAPGNFLLAAFATGYRDTRAGVFELGADGEISLEFRVYPLPIPLDGIVVTAAGESRDPALIRSAFYQRRDAGFGWFAGPQDLDGIPGIQTADLFRDVPRLDIRWDAVRGNQFFMFAPLGDCRPTLWVDGFLLTREPIERDLPLRSQIAAIEVYRGPAELPIQWGGTQANGCGAIVVWTKS